MTEVLAIDPGSEQSAFLRWNGTHVGPFGLVPNEQLLEQLRRMQPCEGCWTQTGVVVIEKIESYGMAVGREVFDTVHWAGRFTEAIHWMPVVQLPRREVKLTICNDSRAKDANIRAALIDMFGGPSAAKGTKASPGPLYGISKDIWSALAIAITYDTQHKGK